jgi:diamine N-acetyltransferase
MSITLREIDASNFRQSINLKVAEGQEQFVASNVASIAQSKVYPHLVPLAAYRDGELVGFAMYECDPEDGTHWIARVMIGAAHQGKGYGRELMLALIEKIGQLPGGDEIFLSIVPGNEAAEKLYRSLGFAPTGEVSDGGEKIMRLKLEAEAND